MKNSHTKKWLKVVYKYKRMFFEKIAKAGIF